MRSQNEPGLFKVGYTKRKTIERRAELNRVAGDNMKIVTTVTMPWARQCEAKCYAGCGAICFVKGTDAAPNGFGSGPRKTFKRSMP